MLLCTPMAGVFEPGTSTRKSKEHNHFNAVLVDIILNAIRVDLQAIHYSHYTGDTARHPSHLGRAGSDVGLPLQS